MGRTKQLFNDLRQDEALIRWNEEQRLQHNYWIDEINKTIPKHKKLTLKKKLKK